MASMTASRMVVAGAGETAEGEGGVAAANDDIEIEIDDDMYNVGIFISLTVLNSYLVVNQRFVL